MQQLMEANLETIFSLELVKSELDLHGLRIDTLAFDIIVIIEYKKDRNFSVVDQGVAYLNLMLNNKADFILEYNERSTHNLKRDDVDWSQSRVIFVAPEFTKYQQHAIGFKDLAIQLYELHRYKNQLYELLVFNEIKPSDRRESIISVAKGNLLAKKVSEEIKVYTEDDLLNAVDDEVKELYSQLKSDVIMLGPDIEVRPTKKYIAFRRRQGFLGIVLLKSKLKTYLSIELGELRDPLRQEM